MTTHKILKFEVQLRGDTMMPAGAWILTAREQAEMTSSGGTQTEKVFVWALVDPHAPLEPRKIRLRGTGHDADPSEAYLGTAFLYDGQLVLHIFEAR